MRCQAAESCSYSSSAFGIKIVYNTCTRDALHLLTSVPSCFGAINAIHPLRPCYNYYLNFFLCARKLEIWLGSPATLSLKTITSLEAITLGILLTSHSDAIYITGPGHEDDCTCSARINRLRLQRDLLLILPIRAAAGSHIPILT